MMRDSVHRDAACGLASNVMAATLPLCDAPPRAVQAPARSVKIATLDTVARAAQNEAAHRRAGTRYLSRLRAITTRWIWLVPS
jgi:hypothetical protein